jgi:adenine-specific DNA methylase
MKVSVSEASVQLGMDEQVYRLAMASAGVDNAETVKEIDINTAAIIADATEAQASGQPLLPQNQTESTAITAVQSVLADFEESLNLDLLKISQAIAFINAKQVAQAYKDVHSAVLKQELGSYAEDTANMLLRTQASVSVTDFLKQRGYTTNSNNNVKSLLSNLEMN